MCKPTQCDIYPQYTIMVVGDGDKSDGGHPVDQYFIQLGSENSPMWAPMNYITDMLFDIDGLFKDEAFVTELIALMNDWKRPYTHLAELLKTVKRQN